MAKKRIRKNKLEFYVSEEEKSFIYAKMQAAKISNLSAYLRKIATVSYTHLRAHETF